MTEPIRLYLDLGDAFTKGLLVDRDRTRRLRFPSAVARSLLADDLEQTRLLVAEQQPLLRPDDFDPAQFPRTRSYPGAAQLLDEVADQAPTEGVRFAGWQAVTYGADRQVLGVHPTRDNVEALVRKALILGRPPTGARVEAVLVVDSGRKADVIQQFAAESPHDVSFELRTLRRPEPRRVELSVSTSTLDAADCAVAALPAELGLERVQRLLLIDVGYFRTKLAVLSPEGCELQTEVPDAGLSECVRRVLRDGQDHGLVEDELAVVRALEKSAGGPIEVAGRSFDIARVLKSACQGLTQELTGAARRAVLDHYARRAEVCRAAAIIGGGAAQIGSELAAGISDADLGLAETWVPDDGSFCLLEGARRRHRDE